MSRRRYGIGTNICSIHVLDLFFGGGSFFLDLLDKEKFSKLISNGKILLSDSFFEINYSDRNKGEITFFFDRNTYDLLGWRLIGIDNNITILEIKNFLKNIKINKSFFTIPEEN